MLSPRRFVSVLVLSCVTAWSCSGSGGGGDGTGGQTTGGQTTGGSSTGGAQTGSGGAPSGGAPGGTGGSAAGGTGGTKATGGAATGGTATGGAKPPIGGGTVATGGGGGHAGTGGAPGAGGTPGAGGATASSGCGMTAPMSKRYSIDVGGMSREYILSVPSNYNPSTPYRLIFAWHPWGGSAEQTAGTGNGGYYGLKGASNNQAVLVSPEGLDFQGMGKGWGNTNGQDIAFFKAMLELFKSQMCIDEKRVFSVGFSFGGMMSNAVGCTGLVRAVAPMAGNSTVSGCTSGTQPVAYMGFHGDHDSVVNISGGRTARDIFVKRNQCTSETTSSTTWCDSIDAKYKPCNCVTYQGCTAGYPVTWCEYNADHQAAPNSGPTLWPFFSQF